MKLDNTDLCVPCNIRATNPYNYSKIDA